SGGSDEGKHNRNPCRVVFKRRLLCAVKRRQFKRRGNGGGRWVWSLGLGHLGGRRCRRRDGGSGLLWSVEGRQRIGAGCRRAPSRRRQRGHGSAGSKRRATKGIGGRDAGRSVFRPGPVAWRRAAWCPVRGGFHVGWHGAVFGPAAHWPIAVP